MGNHKHTTKAKRYLPIVYIVISGILISILLFIAVNNWERKSRHKEFEFLANAYCTNIENTLIEYVGALRFLGDFFNNSPREVTRKQFAAIVDSIMNRYAGIRAFGWDPLVKDEDRHLYVSAAKKEGLSDFKFTERTEKNELVKAEQRKEYVVVYYIHPIENNRAALGYDIASNPIRYEAIKKSFETGKLYATGRLNLVQESGNKYGVLILLPIYHRKELINSSADRFKKRKGFVVEVLSIGTAIENSIKSIIEGGLYMTLSDMSASPSEQLLYSYPSLFGNADKKPIPENKFKKGFHWSKTIDFAERQWKVSLWPSKDYFQTRKLWQPWVILFGSILLTVVLGFYMYKKIEHTIEIEQRVDIQIQTNLKLKNEIQKHKITEESLESQNRLMTTLLDNLQVGVFMVEAPEGKPLLANKKAIDLLGREIRPEADKTNLSEIYQAYKLDTGELYPQDQLPILTALEGKQHSIDDMIVVKPDGEKLNLEVHGSPVTNQSGEITASLISFTDITNRKAMEAQLQQAQKMESVGRLAGGVAHDFNNMLSIILGNIELLIEDIDRSNPIANSLKEVKKAAERSTKLTHQLLAFARKQTIAPKILDLNDTIDGMLRMLRRLIGEDIDLSWNPSGDLWPVKIDPSQIDQILANLCVNSRDAINDIGRITIETTNMTFDDSYCKTHIGFKPGNFATISVSDDGCGMDDDTTSKLFEPFFTTKKDGKGTGLGLATVYGIVKQNNGFISVYSEVGQGTTIKIYIPRHSEKFISSKKRPLHREILRGHETILIVEDVNAILEISKRMIERLGYKVLTANGPMEAIETCHTFNQEIHLLITDVIMPAMNGRDLANKILKLRPGIKCLYMSGYTSNVIAHHGVLDENLNFINKPFSIQDLSAKLREILDGENQ